MHPTGAHRRGERGPDPATHPRLAEDQDWYLSDVLRRELVRLGYREVPEYGWQGSSSEETAWLYALFKTADALDAEIRRLEWEMRARSAPVRTYCVLREGGPDAAPEEAEAMPAREPGEIDESGEPDDEPAADPRWLEDRILVDIYAYNEAHAMYLFAMDFTQPLTDDHPKDMPFPRDYQIGVIELLEYLMAGEDGRADIAGAMGRLLAMDLEGYRLVPSYHMPLNREELEARAGRRPQPPTSPEARPASPVATWPSP
jgi:hypothetical protein